MEDRDKSGVNLIFKNGISLPAIEKKSHFIYVHREGSSYKEFLCLMEIIREVMSVNGFPVYLMENDRKNLVFYDMYVHNYPSGKIKFIFDDHIPSDSLLDCKHKERVVCFFDGNIDVFAETRRPLTSQVMLCLFKRRVKTKDVICHAISLGLKKLYVLSLDYESPLVIEHFHKVMDHIGCKELEICDLGELKEEDFSHAISLGKHIVQLGSQASSRIQDIAKGLLFGE